MRTPKYIVGKLDGSPMDPQAKYLVLRIDGKPPNSPEDKALRTYIAALLASRDSTLWELAGHLLRFYGQNEGPADLAGAVGGD